MVCQMVGHYSRGAPRVRVVGQHVQGTREGTERATRPITGNLIQAVSGRDITIPGVERGI